MSGFAASIPKSIDAGFQEHKIVIALEYIDRSLTRIGLTDNDVMRDFVIVAPGLMQTRTVLMMKQKRGSNVSRRKDLLYGLPTAK